VAQPQQGDNMTTERRRQLRRFAVQLEAQMPEDTAEARLVLEFLAELVAWEDDRKKIAAAA
jgi:hypothetical protein